MSVIPYIACTYVCAWYIKYKLQSHVLCTVHTYVLYKHTQLYIYAVMLYLPFLDICTKYSRGRESSAINITSGNRRELYSTGPVP